MDHYLYEVLLIIFAAVLVVAVFKKLNLSPVLGYFVAGGVIGEHGFKIISSEKTHFFGEIGVVFLLFAIGLELTFERLKSMRTYVFGFGSLQVVLTALSLGSISYFIGPGLSASTIIGGGLALSSTAIVLQVLAENREQATQVGRVSLAVLLMQDFAVVPLLVIVPMLAGEQPGIIKPLGEAFIKALLALGVIFVLGRLLLRPLFHAISSPNSAKSSELFIATTLLIALGTAYMTGKLGLSLALGAFAAGLLVAETEFQLQAEEAIAPFKGLLLGLFFMGVGMSIDLQAIIDQLPLVTLISLGVILIKAIIIIILGLIFGFPASAAIHSGLLLAQGGEFAFILFRLADQKGILDSEISQILLLVVTITMALTPMLGIIGSKIAEKLDENKKVDTDNIYKEIADVTNHVVIIGFGKVGKMVAYILEAENINYVALDINAEHVSKERDEGFPVYLGDASNVTTMKSIGVDRASSIILALDNEITLKKISKAIRLEYKDIPIIVRSEDLSMAEELTDAGATTIVPETYETGLQLGGAVLTSIGVSDFEVSRIKNQFRSTNYHKLPKQELIEEENEKE